MLKTLDGNYGRGIRSETRLPYLEENNLGPRAVIWDCCCPCCRPGMASVLEEEHIAGVRELLGAVAANPHVPAAHKDHALAEGERRWRRRWNGQDPDAGVAVCEVKG